MTQTYNNYTNTTLITTLNYTITEGNSFIQYLVITLLLFIFVLAREKNSKKRKAPQQNDSDIQQNENVINPENIEVIKTQIAHFLSTLLNLLSKIKKKVIM